MCGVSTTNVMMTKTMVKCNMGNTLNYESTLQNSTSHQRDKFGAVGSLMARASYSRPEGLRLKPDARKYPPRTHGVRAR
ncbi:hypothetical protein TNCV_5071241 [Trichonephila clavipes]|nr:hypothetical protein TNCV_5071241 [Trichonephila clavipes]